MADRDKCIEAAARLEELAIEAREIVNYLRTVDDNTPWCDPYARVYQLRTEIGYVVRTLGVGVPPASSKRR